MNNTNICERDIWEVIQSYFASHKNILSLNQLNSFNTFISTQLPKTVRQFNPISLDQEGGSNENQKLIFNSIKYKLKLDIIIGGEYDDKTDNILNNGKSISLGKPIIDGFQMDSNSTQKKLLYPNEARLKNLTYSSMIFTDIIISFSRLDLETDTLIDTVEYIDNLKDKSQLDENYQVIITSNKIIKIFKNIPIGRVPIMLHSNICLLYNQSDKTVREMGECPYNQGGYFIISGKEKVIVAQERQRENTIYVYHTNNDNIIYTGEVRSASENKFEPPKVTRVKILKPKRMTIPPKYLKDLYFQTDLFIDIGDKVSIRLKATIIDIDKSNDTYTIKLPDQSEEIVGVENLILVNRKIPKNKKVTVILDKYNGYVIGKNKEDCYQVQLTDGSQMTYHYHDLHVDLSDRYQRENVNNNIYCGDKHNNKFPPIIISENTIRVEIPDVKFDIPLFILFRCLGIINDKDIVNYILYDVNDKKLIKSYLTILKPSIIEARAIKTQLEAFCYLKAMYVYNGNLKNTFPPQSENEYLDIIYLLTRKFLPHLSFNLNNKAHYLGYFIKTVLDTKLNIKTPTSRDCFMYKSVDISGHLLAQLFRDLYFKFKNNVRDVINTKCTKLAVQYNGDLYFEDEVNITNIENYFNFKIIDDGMIYAFRNSWGVPKLTTCREGIVQDLNIISAFGTLSNLRRLSNPVPNSAKIRDPRSLNSSTWGIICPSETPDGGNVGVQKNLSLQAIITLDNSSFSLETCLFDLGLSYLDNLDIRQIKNKTLVILNGRIEGFHHNPQKLMRDFICLRRNGYINRYVSISWQINDNTINILTNSGRCCRPLLIVKKGTLVLSKKWINRLKYYRVLITFKDKTTEMRNIDPSIVNQIINKDENIVKIIKENILSDIDITSVSQICFDTRDSWEVLVSGFNRFYPSNTFSTVNNVNLVESLNSKNENRLFTDTNYSLNNYIKPNENFDKLRENESCIEYLDIDEENTKLISMSRENLKHYYDYYEISNITLINGIININIDNQTNISKNKLLILVNQTGIIIEYPLTINNFSNNIITTTKTDITDEILTNLSVNGFILINSNNSRLKPTHSHCEIHPCLILGIMASIIPFIGCNQAPRNQFSGAQTKQGIGVFATNYLDRMDTKSQILLYPQKPIVDTSIGKYINTQSLPYGQNAIVAIGCFTGYNQDDSIIMNQSSIDRGLFRSIKYRTYLTEEEVTKNGEHKKIKYPNDLENLPAGNFGLLRKGGLYDGIISEEVKVNENDALIGVTLEKKNENQDNSVFIRKNESGIVDKVYLDNDVDGNKYCKIRIRKEKIPELGDKFASRHGQKGVIGMKLNETDLIMSENGLSPDMIINPQAFPKRMTIGQLVETVFGKQATLKGELSEMTNFVNITKTEIGEVLQKLGFHKYGNEILYNSITGEQLLVPIFIGPTYYQRLYHQVDDKVYSRGEGAQSALSHQPVGGRALGGGLRIGEMERDALLGHGIASFLKESMMERSDKYKMWIDNRSGCSAIVNTKTKLFKSLDGYKQISYYNELYKCNTKKQLEISSAGFSQIEIPYAFKLFIQEMISMSIMPRIIPKTVVSKWKTNSDINKLKTLHMSKFVNKKNFKLNDYIQPFLDFHNLVKKILYDGSQHPYATNLLDLSNGKGNDFYKWNKYNFGSNNSYIASISPNKVDIIETLAKRDILKDKTYYIVEHPLTTELYDLDYKFNRIYLFPNIKGVDRTQLKYSINKSDNEGIYSITKPYLSYETINIFKKYLNDLSDISVTDASGGIGGDIINFARYFKKVKYFELNPERLTILRHNIDVYKPYLFTQAIEFVGNDFTNGTVKVNTDIIYVDPPWGGTNYKSIKNIEKQIDEKMNLVNILKNICTYNLETKLVCFKLPLKYNIKNTEFLGKEIRRLYTLHTYNLTKFKLLIFLVKKHFSKKLVKGHYKLDKDGVDFYNKIIYSQKKSPKKNIFDVCSLFFNIQQYCCCRHTLQMVLDNIAMSLKYRGLFLVTCLDGDILAKQIIDKKLVGYIESLKDPIWEITKGKNKEWSTPNLKYNLDINLKLKWRGNEYFTENLVFKKSLIVNAVNVGLTLLNDDETNKRFKYLNSATGNFWDIYQNITPEFQQNILNTPEYQGLKEFIKLHRYYIFTFSDNITYPKLNFNQLIPCQDWIHNYQNRQLSNFKYKSFQQFFYTIDNKNQIPQIINRRGYYGNNTTIKDKSIIKDAIFQNFKYNNINKQSLVNTFNFMFNNVGYGVFVKIVNNIVVMFIPFYNREVKNNIKNNLNLKSLSDIELFFKEKKKYFPEIDDPITNINYFGTNNCGIISDYSTLYQELHSNFDYLEIKNMLEQYLSFNTIANIEFFINKKSTPVLPNLHVSDKLDLFSDKLDLFSDKLDLSDDIKHKFVPILSNCSNPNTHLDVMFPTSTDWKMVTDEYLPMKCNKIDIPEKITYPKRYPKAYYRGTLTGCNTQNNIIEKLCQISNELITRLKSKDDFSLVNYTKVSISDLTLNQVVGIFDITNNIFEIGEIMKIQDILVTVKINNFIFSTHYHHIYLLEKLLDRQYSVSKVNYVIGWSQILIDKQPYLVNNNNLIGGLIDAKITSVTNKTILDKNIFSFYQSRNPNQQYVENNLHFTSQDIYSDNDENIGYQYKYIFYTDSIGANYDYSNMMKLNSLIFKIESTQNYQLWYFHKLKGITLTKLYNTSDKVTNIEGDHIIIPYDFDKSTLVTLINWCNNNENICLQIVKNNKQKYDEIFTKQSIFNCLHNIFKQIALNQVEYPIPFPENIITKHEHLTKTYFIKNDKLPKIIGSQLNSLAKQYNCDITILDKTHDFIKNSQKYKVLRVEGDKDRCNKLILNIDNFVNYNTYLYPYPFEFILCKFKLIPHNNNTEWILTSIVDTLINIFKIETEIPKNSYLLNVLSLFLTFKSKQTVLNLITSETSFTKLVILYSLNNPSIPIKITIKQTKKDLSFIFNNYPNIIKLKNILMDYGKVNIKLIKEPSFCNLKISGLLTDVSSAVTICNQNLNNIYGVNYYQKPEITLDISNEILSLTNNIAILIPFRNLDDSDNIKYNRELQLDKLITHFKAFFKKHHYTIFVVSQDDIQDDEYTDDIKTDINGKHLRKFNRGALINIGIELIKNSSIDFKSVIIHDVDLLPKNNMLSSYLEFPININHLASRWSRYTFNDSDYLGGALHLSMNDIIQVNGYPNHYWGWGDEDYEFRQRLLNHQKYIVSKNYNSDNFQDLEQIDKVINKKILVSERVSIDSQGINNIDETYRNTSLNLTLSKLSGLNQIDWYQITNYQNYRDELFNNVLRYNINILDKCVDPYICNIDDLIQTLNNNYSSLDFSPISSLITSSNLTTEKEITDLLKKINDSLNFDILNNSKDSFLNDVFSRLKLNNQIKITTINSVLKVTPTLINFTLPQYVVQLSYKKDKSLAWNYQYFNRFKMILMHILQIINNQLIFKFSDKIKEILNQILTKSNIFTTDVKLIYTKNITYKLISQRNINSENKKTITFYILLNTSTDRENINEWDKIDLDIKKPIQTYTLKYNNQLVIQLNKVQSDIQHLIYQKLNNNENHLLITNYLTILNNKDFSLQYNVNQEQTYLFIDNKVFNPDINKNISKIDTYKYLYDKTEFDIRLLTLYYRQHINNI